MNNKYKQAKIFQISSDQTDKIYIGSTTENYLSQRFGTLNFAYRKYLEGFKPYSPLYDLLKYNDCTIELISLFPCNNYYELLNEETKIKNQFKEFLIPEAKHQREQILDLNIVQIPPTICECGMEVYLRNKGRHLKSVHHLKYLNTLNNENTENL